jgi:pentatricopeptide repeat protein
MRSCRPLGLCTLALYFFADACVAQIGSRIEVREPEAAIQPTPIEVGDALMLHQRYQAAIEAYKRAPQDSPEAWNKMGVAYQLLRNVNEASRCYHRALKLNPKNGTYFNNIGSVHMEHQEYSQAVKSFHKAVKLAPKNALFEKNLGTGLLSQKKYEDGWKAYERAVALDPHIFERGADSVRVQNPASIQDRGAMNYYMAKGCVRAGMHEKAIDYLRLALNEGFTNPKKILADPGFAPLHDLPAFRQMMEAQGVYLVSNSGTPVLVH